MVKLEKKISEEGSSMKKDKESMGTWLLNICMFLKNKSYNALL